VKTLQKNIANFSYVNREIINEKVVGNKCGRDFLYYALNFYFPDTFNAFKHSPITIDRQRLFGKPVPAWLAWTQIQFANVANYLKHQGLRLRINDRLITGYFSFVAAILFSRKTFADAILQTKSLVDANHAVGIDISLGFGGLLDHVLFVYGYDEQNLYVFDTHRVASLEYEPQNHKHVFKLPISVIEKRWTRFGRVWEVASIM
jgi:hypothetical protein